MAVQLILCVETKKSADTDTIYIKNTINHWYQLDNTTKISIINMESKSRYNSKSVTREITRKTKDFIHGKTKVIYFIDTDQLERNAYHKKEFDEISRYCENNGYELVWFCHDIEEVFWGHTVTDSQKVQEAIKFKKNKMIEQIQINKLTCDSKRTGVSNIIQVFDKYLVRK